jgi:hypothetical protein
METGILRNITFSEGVASVMYAASAHVIYTESLRISTQQFAISVIFLIFLCIDWVSRVRVSISLPAEDQKERRRIIFQFLTGCIVVVCPLLLALAAVSLLKPDSIPKECWDWEKALTIFFIISLLWNLVTLFFMRSLPKLNLLYSIFAGNALDLEGASIYTERFLKKTEELEEELGNEIKHATNGREHYEVHGHIRRVFIRLGFARTIAQLFAFHITWANFVVGFVLWFQADWFFFVSRYFIGNSYLLGTRVLLGILLFVIPVVFFFLYEESKFKNRKGEDGIPKSSKVLKTLAGISCLVLILMLYASFNLRSLIFLVLFQHGVFDLFLQLAIPTHGMVSPTTTDAYLPNE